MRHDDRLKVLASTAAVLTVAASTIGALLAHWRFNRKRDALARHLDNSQIASGARTDIPSEVIALAARLGARSERPTRTIDLRQTGTMWFKPGGQPRAFTARQKIGTMVSGFVWCADFGPFGSIKVVDSFVAGCGYLEARMLGALRVARIDGTVAINEGEALRYLAELPFNPDAILFCHALDWSIDGAGTIKVATGKGASRAEIVFNLDKEGLISTAQAASRAFDATGQRHPWHGRFWDYQECSGRLVPMQAEVAWVIDGKDFIYWRGTMTQWVARTKPMSRG
jgi:hypothetical protein